MTTQETIDHLALSIKSYTTRIYDAVNNENPPERYPWMPEPKKDDPLPQAELIAKLSKGLSETLAFYFAAKNGATVEFKPYQGFAIIQK